MSQNISGQLKVALSFIESLAVGASSGNIPSGTNFNENYATGSGTGQTQVGIDFTSTPDASTPDTWNLASLTDSIGRTIAFTKVLVLLIVNNAAHPLLLTGGASNPVGWLPGSSQTAVTIAAGGALLLTSTDATALAVASGSADTIKLDPGDNAGNYTLYAYGQ